MTVETRVQSAARFLLDERRARRRFVPIPAPFTPESVDEAYEVQETMHALSNEEHGALAGYKIALTTAVMQKMVGSSEPIAGPVYAGNIRQSPAALRVSDYVHLGAECEIGFHMSTTLAPSGSPYTLDEVAGAVDSVFTSFEIVDDRGADFSQLATQITSATADDVWNAGAVLGPPVADWRGLDLAKAEGRLRINGAEAGSGTGADVLGHPLEALTWLANMLSRRGRSVERDMIVLTGSIVALKYLKPGDELVFEIDLLGSVQIRVS